MRRAGGPQRGAGRWQLLASLAGLGLVVALVFFGVRSLRVGSEAARLEMTEQAVRRTVTQCYALEGRYPPDLNYLTDRYGLLLDTDRYVYHYRLNGANLMPEILVFPR